MVPRRSHRLGSGAEAVAVVLVRLEREVGRNPPRTERVPVEAALGRVPSVTIRARRVLPPRDQSTMDGFAVRAQPLPLRNPGSSLVLRVIGRSYPGDDGHHLPRVNRHTAVEVVTGAVLPSGADSVIRTEDCRRAGENIRVRVPIVLGHDVARRGEDFRPGQAIVTAGTPLRPWHIAALVANEIASVRVARGSRVGVLSTGAELVAAGESLSSGRVRDTTKPLLFSLLAELGASSLDLGIVPDREEAIRRAVRRGLAVCDVLLTSGGSSVGTRDLVPRAIQGMGGVRWIATRLRLRPGSATGVAVVRHRPVFLLSGPPVAAFAGFVGVVEPFLRARGSVAAPTRSSVTARLDRRLTHSRGVRELVRVRLELRNGAQRAFVVERHGASRLSSLTEANGLLILEEQRGDYREGENVQVLRL